MYFPDCRHAALKTGRAWPLTGAVIHIEEQRSSDRDRNRWIVKVICESRKIGRTGISLQLALPVNFTTSVRLALLAEAAGKLPVPKEVQFKPKSAWRYIGKEQPIIGVERGQQLAARLFLEIDKRHIGAL